MHGVYTSQGLVLQYVVPDLDGVTLQAYVRCAKTEKCQFQIEKCQFQALPIYGETLLL
jgi:hypothetical protein